jgi:glycosyltransferase involved in cell wall biosynthesis
VLQQEYKNVEHIIMDGGSTDGTVDILKQYPHLVWFSEKDSGQSHAMNKAFEKATGDIIVYLNADDWFDATVFSAVVAEFEKSKNDIVIGNGTFVTQGKSEQVPWASSYTYKECLQHFRYDFPLNPFTYFYKRSVQEEIGGFNQDNHYAMDYEFILRMLQDHRASKLESNFGFFWFDGKNKTSNRSSLLDCKKVAIQHCLKFDKVSLPAYLAGYYGSRVKAKMDQWLR